MSTKLLSRVLAIVCLCAVTVLDWSVGASPVSAAGDGNVSFEVLAAYSSPPQEPFRDFAVTEGAPVGDFKWLINEDSIGDVTFDPSKCLPTSAQDANTPTAGTAYPGPNGEVYPDLCTWPSVRAIDGHSKIVASGDQGDIPSGGLTLPNGKYLVSVMSDGYKIDGAHFTVNEVDQTVVVKMNPLPLPSVTVRVQVFNDNASTNGQFDGVPETYVPANGPGDPGPNTPERNNMSGFTAQMSDIAGEVNFDVYGNPLCTEYQTRTNDNGTATLTDDFEEMIFDGDSGPIPVVLNNGGATGGQLAGGTTQCISDREGTITIPNVGPNRYAVTVIPPDPQNNAESANKWIQTTTLEGGHDWDTWNMEGSTGYDTELVVGGENVPFVTFGFVQRQDVLNNAAVPGKVKGKLMIGRTYVAQTTGLPNPGNIWGGGTGTELQAPVEDGWVSLACLSGCVGPTDEAQIVQRANADGTFQLDNVPDGTYTLTVWDESQIRILDFVQVTVGDGRSDNGNTGGTVDIGSFPLAGWFTDLEGSVFLDRNANGKRDGVGTPYEEPGVPEFGLTLRTRVNTLNDQGQASAVTNSEGEWDMAAYPLGQFLILEAYHSGYHTTGATWTLGNNPTPHTQLTDQVDWNVLNIFGLGGKFDVGVLPYAPDENGGIVGTVQYDVTRNELNPRNAASEDWQPGVPGVTMQLWVPHKDSTGNYVPAANGAVKQFGAGGCARPEDEYGTIDELGVGCDPVPNNLDEPTTQQTESWTRPYGCVARTADGTPAYSQVLPQSVPGDYAGGEADYPCFEAPMMSVQFGEDGAVDGNYGFGDLNTGDYLVEAIPPASPVVAGGNTTAYKFTDETAVNVFTGDSYVSQGPWGWDQSGPSGPPTPVAQNDYRAKTVDVPCAGRQHVINTTNPVGADYQPNPTLNDNGGTPVEGLSRPYCDVKLIRVQPRRSIAPIFHIYTDVPIPTRFVGYIIDDLSVSTNPKSTVFGEKAGMQNVPVGIYDFSGRHVYTAESDYNGYYEALLPSTATIACPTPSGVCPNVYRLIGNDPGQVDAPNNGQGGRPLFNPQYRTISTNFQGWAGVVHPVDQAPTRIAASFQLPGSQGTYPPACAVPAAQPEFFTINKPYADVGTGETFTITGKSFGIAEGQVIFTLGNNEFALPEGLVNWNSDTSISFTLPGSLTTAGAYNLRVVGANGQTATNGVTFHLRGPGYNPPVFEVRDLGGADVTSPATAQRFDPDNDPIDGSGPRAIQRAINAADVLGGNNNNNNGNVIIVVYPNLSDRYADFNPDRAYFENVVIHNRVKLQGIGAGGAGTPGSRIDGRYLWSAGAADDGVYFQSWQTLVQGLQKAGAPNGAEPVDPAGQVIYVRPETTNQFNGNFNPAIDGFTITGGDQQGFPTNLNFLGGGPNGTPRPAVVEAQGGGIFVTNFGRNTRITNNVLVSNGGSFGGAIRIGTPELGTTQATSTNNTGDIRILRNRIVANGGTMFAGAIGLFYGSNDYEVGYNDICGNFSAEYGGGISHYGRSPGGRIHHNKVYFNQAYDEAGGIMIGGEIPANNTVLSAGAGDIQIDHNEIIANLSNDDGGGVRFLMAAGPSNFRMNVNDNIIANNVATHEGGGIAIDDTPRVEIVNNTIVKNITTATAMTSDGSPAPAGVSTGANSSLLQARLNSLYGAAVSPKFSNPVILNNIFADNRAGEWTSTGVAGIGLPGDPRQILRWDVGTTDGSGTPRVHGSLVDSNAADVLYQGGTGFVLGTGGVTVPQSANLQTGSASGIAKVQFKAVFDTQVSVASWRTFPNFRAAAIVTVDQPVAQLANYHLLETGRTAPEVVVNTTRTSLTAQPNNGNPNGYFPVNAPNTDIDNSTRPFPAGVGNVDRGADELSPLPALVPPLAGTPAVVLDSFDRDPSTDLGTDWTKYAIPLVSPMGINRNEAIGRANGFEIWGNTSIAFGANQKASFVITALPASTVNSSISLVLKANGASTFNLTPSKYIEVRYSERLNRITVGYATGGSSVPVTTLNIPINLNSGAILTATASSTGQVQVFNGTILLGTADVTGFGASNNAAGGSIGMRYLGPNGTTVATTTKVNDFRGGTL